MIDLLDEFTNSDTSCAYFLKQEFEKQNKKIFKLN